MKIKSLMKYLNINNYLIAMKSYSQNASKSNFIIMNSEIIFTYLFFIILIKSIDKDKNEKLFELLGDEMNNIFEIAKM